MTACMGIIIQCGAHVVVQCQQWYDGTMEQIGQKTDVIPRFCLQALIPNAAAELVRRSLRYSRCYGVR